MPLQDQRPAAPRIVIYTTRFCYWCRRAVHLLEELDLPFDRRDVSGDREARARLREASAQTTVPQVFIDGRSIGGCQELEALERSGELDRLLQVPAPAAPAPLPV